MVLRFLPKPTVAATLIGLLCVAVGPLRLFPAWPWLFAAILPMIAIGETLAAARRTPPPVRVALRPTRRVR